MGTTFVSKKLVPENVGWEYDVDLTKENGQPITVAAWVSLTVRIYADDAGKTDIVATPDSVLNAGRGVVTDGHLALTFTPADSVIVNPASEINDPDARRQRIPGERHVCELEGVYAVNRQFARKITWPVENFTKRT